ncbi:MAG: hypothetical protein IPN49_15810 [Saprospiraceae bacterium]|nr:hypothetical protein [Saprospiraceae bacterium]
MRAISSLPKQARIMRSTSSKELASQIDDKKAWAQLMSEMLLELLKQAKIDINQNIKNRVFIEKQYDIIISDGKKEEPPPQKSGKRGKYKRSKGLNLLERLEFLIR